MENEEIDYNSTRYTAEKKEDLGKKLMVRFNGVEYTREIVYNLSKEELFKLFEAVGQSLRDININCEIAGAYTVSALTRKKYYNILSSWIVSARRKYTLDFHKIFYRVCHEDLPEALVNELKAKAKMLSDKTEGE